MERYVTVRRSFSAGHTEPSCGPRHHGHTYSLKATAGSKDADALVKALDAFVGEIDQREMTEQFPAVPPTPEGLALFLLERLRLTVPSILRVRIGTGQMSWEVIDR